MPFAHAAAVARTLLIGSILTAGIVLPSAPARAQDGTIATAKELLDTKGAANIFDGIVVNLVEQTKNMFMQTSPMLSRDLNEVATTLRNEFQPRRAELIEEFAKVYAARFTEQELKEALAFYKTPTGKKVVQVEPAVLEQGFAYARQWQGRISEEIMSRFRAEMKKKGHDL